MIKQLLYLTLVSWVASSQKLAPAWPTRYYAEGVLSLPYADLEEPFQAWYDGAEKMSRIDYYQGMSQTVQRGDRGAFGQHYMVAPITNEKVLNVRTCFTLPGEKGAPVLPQTVLPDLNNFTTQGEKEYKGKVVQVWEMHNKLGERWNHYSIYIDSGNKLPVFYEMMGYDSLIGSHYDDYKVSYSFFSFNFPQTMFDLPIKGMDCHGFPGPGHERSILMNPMQEYIHPRRYEHVHNWFNHFIDKFDKIEANRNPEVYQQKKDTFKHNLRYINSMNRRNLTYKLKVNHLADKSSIELKRLRGFRHTEDPRPHAVEPNFKMTINDVPKEMNWRYYGAVTPVKDQATCGSCWSFGTTGAIEGAYFLKHGELKSFSQQNLMDCSWGFGNNACDGGENWRSYEWIIKHGGLMTERDYGHYLGQDGYCHFDEKKSIGTIASYVNVTSGSAEALKLALAEAGPVAVAIDAAHLSLSFYSHGVYYEPKCGNTTIDLDHAVLAVGYGILDGHDYWLVKNSWSTHWGNDGYVMFSQKDNNCGVATDATFVNMA